MHGTCASWRATGDSPASLCQGLSESPVLSFSRSQLCDAVIRWNTDVVFCVRLFSMMMKFLTSVSVAAEVPESLLQIHSREVWFGSEDWILAQNSVSAYSALLKLENIYSAGLASTEQSIKQSTLWRAINNSCSYFILILYGTIFLR